MYSLKYFCDDIIMKWKTRLFFTRISLIILHKEIILQLKGLTSSSYPLENCSISMQCIGLHHIRTHTILLCINWWFCTHWPMVYLQLQRVFVLQIKLDNPDWAPLKNWGLIFFRLINLHLKLEHDNIYIYIHILKDLNSDQCLASSPRHKSLSFKLRSSLTLDPIRSPVNNSYT